MWRPLSECTRHLNSFIPSSLRLLAASSGGNTASTISRVCWSSAKSGVTPKTSPNRWEYRPGRCSAFSPIPAGTMTRSSAASKNTWDPSWLTLRPVWVLDGSDFPKQGRKSAGVARQYCGRLGKVANCQAGMFLAYVSPLGRALADKRLYLPKSWTSDSGRCEEAGVPADRRQYRSKMELALEMLERARERGQLVALWVAGDDAFGMSPPLRNGLAALGMRYVLDVPAGTTVWPLEPLWSSPADQGFGRPRKPRLQSGQRLTMEERSDELPEEAWREITLAEGSQGPRAYRFSAQRVRETRNRKPGEVLWAVYRRNLDGSESRYYLSNAPEDTPLETLAHVGGSRWRIETEFETEKSDVGLDEYETRTWSGWHHHVALCLLGGAFLLSLQQDWGEKDAPDHPAPSVPGGAGDAAPGAVRAGGTAAVAGGSAATQRAGQTLPSEAPRRPSNTGRHPSLNPTL